MNLTKEQKLIFLVTIFPLIRDLLEDVRDDYPLYFRQNIKKNVNELINDLDKLGTAITGHYNGKDLEEARHHYQQLYELHLKISSEVINKQNK